eukprot:scaffold32435_cov50-Phaeocystis_antarctica.AAC.1
MLQHIVKKNILPPWLPRRGRHPRSPAYCLAARRWCGRRGKRAVRRARATPGEVCRLDVSNVQFVDCTRHKPGLQTGIQFANCVHPVCKLGKSSFRVLGCKWVTKKKRTLTRRTRSRSMAVNAEEGKEGEEGEEGEE